MLVKEPCLTCFPSCGSVFFQLNITCHQSPMSFVQGGRRLYRSFEVTAHRERYINVILRLQCAVTV
jgi:hypothetical protein